MYLLVSSLLIVLYIHLQSIHCDPNKHDHLDLHHSNVTSANFSSHSLTSPITQLLSFPGSTKKPNKNSLTSNVTYFQSPLDNRDDYHLFWSIDYDAKVVSFEVRLKLKSKSNWFVIGLSNYGEPAKSDVCIFWTDRLGRHHFQDGWTDDKGYINIDAQNDCQLINLQSNGKTIRFLFHRDFDTCDINDRPIEDGTNHIIYAEGPGPIKHAYGLNLYKVKHGFQRLQLLKSTEKVPDLPADVRIIDVTNDNVVIPDDETTYWCKLVKFPEDIKRKHHIVRYESNIHTGNEALVHHMEIFHCEVDQSVELPSWNGPCHDKSKPPILEACSRVLSAWAIGAGPFSYPGEAGLPFGGSNFSLYAMLEVHYNNPNHRSGIKDNSGIRLYYTPNLRTYDVGVLEIGLTYNDKNSIPPNSSSFILSGYCVTECTRVGLPSTGITVFASQLHTHLTGRKVWTRHFRGGVELPILNRDDHYSAHFQEIRALKRRVQVLPGDLLINSCLYDTTSRDTITLGGFSISNEMCVNYMHYYPRSSLEVCKSSVDDSILARYFDYLSSNEKQNTSSIEKSIADNYRSIEWTPYRTRFLDKFYSVSPLSMECRRSDGDLFPGDWNGVSLPELRVELKPKSPCSQPEEALSSERR
ncbi:dopamine beta-hydroxylase-like [Tetranychus urticae]|uniref:Dopamine beta-hydroxylase n=1 Tax=Tetranychus urticae TaxID=32264 RepID=T1K603_TETUR|nr:dopamine beta-hydroxylase-like [Tetranychus urticae]